MAVALAHAVALKRKRAAANPDKSTSRKKPKPEADVATLAAQIQESHKHYNNIVALINICKDEAADTSRALDAAIATCRVFCRLISEGRLSKSKNATENELTVLRWLRARQKEYLEVITKIIVNGEADDRYTTAITLAMQVVKQEVINAKGPQETVWRQSAFDTLIPSILLGSNSTDVAAVWVEKYAQDYDDIRHHFFRATSTLLSKASEESPENHAQGALNIALKLEVPASKQLTKFYASRDLDAETPIKLLSHRKLAQQTWLQILQSSLSKDARKAILNTMTYTVVPWFPAPERLMDFLTDAFNVGGATSLLALSGMFYLITEKNLDYPSFYTKLYSLLDADVLHSKHRSRFFRLLNTFMGSTHLPANLVASFIKRLSRRALHAPPAGVVAVIPWIYNMFKAHPATTFLMHRVPRTEEEQAAIAENGFLDPFDDNETDPNSTGAIDSCVWELVSLQSHYHPNVASLARIISEQFTKAHYNLEDFLDHSYNSLIEAELGVDEVRELKKAPEVEFEIPKKVFVDISGQPVLEALLEKALEMQ